MKTKLYQVYYNDNQPLDPDCIPLDSRGVDVVPLYENHHILDAYKTKFDDADYYGVTSWRMKQKTGLTKKEIDDFIEKNPAQFYTYYKHGAPTTNPLVQNIRSNTNIGKAIMRLIELGLFEQPNVEGYWVNVYANYFIATKEMWDKYIPYLEKAIELCKTDEVLVEIMKNTFNHRGEEYPLLCFVLEYLPGLFLSEHKDIVHKYIPHKAVRWQGLIGAQMDLLDIYKKYQAPGGFGDKGTLHHYIENYGKLFHKYREQPITFMEIGVCQGHSLKMWRDFFPNARIIGIDINPPVLDIEGCEFYICDQNNPETINTVLKDIEFDIIIDDGSHVLEHQITSFKTLFDKVKKDGLYIIEDIGGVSHNVDGEIEILKNELGACDVLDTRDISKRYDDILMVWKK